MAKLERWDAGGQNLIRRQYAALEASIALIVSDADVNLAAFQHGGLFATKGLGQFHLHIGKAFSVSRQEFDKTLSIVCGGAATFSTPLSPRRSTSTRSPSDVDMGQYTATISEQLLADRRSGQGRRPTRSNSLKPELLLEVA